MAAAAGSRKRAAATEDEPTTAHGSSPAAAGAKRRRYALASVDDYQQLDVVGDGASGAVIMARHRRTGNKVALKHLPHGARDFDAVRVEAACQGACRGHPNIVQIKDVAADANTGGIFLVMEFVGGSLRDEIPRALPEKLVRVMMRQLVDAAKKMHASHVIHRDIKPENILNSFGDLKVCDFGSATFVNPAGKPYEECVVGTLPYTSPEQLAGNHCYGPGVDMWALGCIMGELLTGAPLFGGDMTEKELLADLTSNLDDQLNELFYDVLPELSPAAREVLSGLLSFDPEKRMTAAEALDHRWFDEEPKKAKFTGYVPLDLLTELFDDVLPELSLAAREVLSGLLAFDPGKRMTAAEALDHRWFANEPNKAGTIRRAHALVLFLFMFAAVLSPGARRELAAEAMHAANERRRRSSGRRDGKAIDQGIGYILMALALVLTYHPAAPDGGDACSGGAALPLTNIYNYDSLGTLGTGACSVVRKARDRRTGDTVAIKCFHPPGDLDDGHQQHDAVAFARERDCLAACCGDPSIVQLLDVAADPWNGDVYLVMEFVGTRTLSNLIVGRPFSEAETRALMRQLLAGAAAIHGAGLIHRDVKPANILVGPGCVLKYCDFGDATPVMPPYEEFLVGTLRFTSPEEVAGDRFYGQSVDMWALGCVMAELLTGRFVFTSSETWEDHVLDLLDLRECDVGSNDSPAFGGLPGLSPAGREVLAGLLTIGHRERMTAEAALEHRWFTAAADSPAVLKRLADLAEKNNL
uniref:Protein kinase domain-containing protein n=1 Tax=Oryza punctata TaxID=4537 RepID=A0A0E0M5L4_ORYPU